MQPFQRSFVGRERSIPGRPGALGRASNRRTRSAGRPAVTRGAHGPAGIGYTRSRGRASGRTAVTDGPAGARGTFGPAHSVITDGPVGIRRTPSADRTFRAVGAHRWPTCVNSSLLFLR